MVDRQEDMERELLWPLDHDVLVSEVSAIHVLVFCGIRGGWVCDWLTK